MRKHTHHANGNTPQYRQHIRMLQRSLCGVLYLCALASLAFLAIHLLGFGGPGWKTYHHVYLLLTLAYTWFVFILLFLSDLRGNVSPPYANERISVIMASYNESPTLLKRAIKSVIDAEGNKEIIVVDDGSTNGSRRMLQEMARKHDIIVHFFAGNQGKRDAIHCAVRTLIGKSKYVVTVDSDTVIDRHALVRLIGALKRKNVGAASGDVQLLNEDENWLTRMAGAYYWTALHIHRKAQSAKGMVSCCSGALAAYRATALRGVIDQFVTQEFFGERCTHSEDRHLTNLILRSGYNVVFVEDAMAYTHTPTTVRSFLKQQQRWKRGFIKEALFSLSFTWKRKPLLFVETLLWDLIIPFASLGIILTVLATVLLHPLFGLFVLLPSWIALMVVRNLPLLIHAREKLPALFLFMLFSTFVLYWQSFYALVTLKNGKWATR